MIYNYFYIKSHSYSVFKMSDLEIFGKYQNPIKGQNIGGIISCVTFPMELIINVSNSQKINTCGKCFVSESTICLKSMFTTIRNEI